MEEPDQGDIKTESSPKKNTQAQPSMLQITLVKELRLGPREARVVKAKLNHTSQNTKEIVGILGPTSNLAARSCDFVKELWTGAEEVYIPINNWSTSPIVVPRDQAVGELRRSRLLDVMAQSGNNQKSQ